jgi:hypothetical protein
MAADTTTPNRGYTLPATGNDVNAWGPLLNANFSAIDTNISGEYTINATGGTVVLTASQAQNVFFNVTGALTSGLGIGFPFTKMFFMMANNTTGNFGVGMGASGGGATVTLAQGKTGVFYSDGTNIIAIGGSTSIPSGTIMGSFLQSTAPVGWTQVTSFNDRVIRVVNDSSGGNTGGSWSINGFTDTPVTLSIAQIPSHTHGQYTDGTTNVGAGGYPVYGGSPGLNGYNTTSTGGGGSHNHGPITNDGTWRPAFCNALVASKN